MYWKLTLDQVRGKLELWNKDTCISARSWEEKRNTSQEILSALEGIKGEQGIEWGEVSKLELVLDLPPHATARRIAETFQNMYTVFVA